LVIVYSIDVYFSLLGSRGSVDDRWECMNWSIGNEWYVVSVIFCWDLVVYDRVIILTFLAVRIITKIR
jgi:hypothetical protein